MPHRIPVIWLASFPKSGNTWLRAMLCRARGGVDTALEDMGALIPDLNSDQDFDGDALDAAAAAWTARGVGETPLFAKTHRPFYELESREILRRGLFERFATGGVIYVARNPLDVAMSLFDFVLLNCDIGDESVETIFAAFVEAFVAQEGHIDLENVHAVNLNEHVQSYRYAAHLHRTLFVRYEDLHAAPAAQLSQVCAFAGMPLQPASATPVAESCSFENMRRLEERKIADRDDGGHEFYRPWRTSGYARGLRFFNQGRVGRGCERMDPAIRRRFRETFQESFDAFGYSAEDATAAGGRWAKTG